VGGVGYEISVWPNTCNTRVTLLSIRLTQHLHNHDMTHVMKMKVLCMFDNGH